MHLRQDMRNKRRRDSDAYPRNGRSKVGMRHKLTYRRREAGGGHIGEGRQEAGGRKSVEGIAKGNEMKKVRGSWALLLQTNLQCQIHI